MRRIETSFRGVLAILRLVVGIVRPTHAGWGSSGAIVFLWMVFRHCIYRPERSLCDYKGQLDLYFF